MVSTHIFSVEIQPMVILCRKSAVHTSSFLITLKARLSPKISSIFTSSDMINELYSEIVIHSLCTDGMGMWFQFCFEKY